MNWRELCHLQFNAPTSEKRVEARKLLDAERIRLYNLDIANGTNLLLNWTRKIGMGEVEIDDNVAIPEAAPAKPATGKRRGRPPGASSKPAENAALLAAVDFVGIVETDAFEHSQYARLSDNFIIAYSNVMVAGHPIAEEINLCPQTAKLRAALIRCGRTLAITEANGQISIKGDKLRALVPCLAEPLANMSPDMPVIQGDFEILKEAFKAGNTVADEKSERMMFASLLLDRNTLTATNGLVLIQYWHGIANLPPGTVIPKVFAQAVAGVKYKITGIGGAFDPTAGFMRSLTIWFDNGSWLKTQCYEDRWQDISKVIDVATNPIPVYEGLFEAVEAVEPFCESQAVYFCTNAVQSHPEGEAGAIYEVKDLPAGKIFNPKLIRQVAPYVKTIDLFAATDRGFFFGGTEANPVRGVFMGMSGSQ
jgi:hypothetical protein